VAGYFNNMNLLHPDPKAMDPLYNKIQENRNHLFKDRVEKLYATCAHLVDKNFSSRIRYDFPSCYSELYFCATFMKRLGLKVEHPADEGPDYYLPDLDCWAEVVTFTSGDKNKPNSISEPSAGAAFNYPKDQIISRITNSFTTKAKKIFKYIENSIIKDWQRVIICISGGWIGSWRIPSYPVGGFPEVVEALLPIGNIVLRMNRENMSIAERTFEFRDSVPKKKENNIIEPIETDYFIRPEYSCISAVIYSYANVTHSIEASNLGNDFFILHNPLATHPLPLGSIKCGIEYKVEVDGDFINITPLKH